MTRTQLMNVLVWAAYAIDQARESDTPDFTRGAIDLDAVANAFGFEITEGDRVTDLTIGQVEYS